MHPVLFKVGSFTVYTYGFCIAVGALLGFVYMYRQGKKQYGVTFDQSNNLFILLVLAGVIGGKLFMIFEDPALYFSQPKKLFSSSGFVFYGSLLTAIPVMLWYFKKIKVPVLGMLDVMAAVTCIVHGLGRIGCFMAGCCYGLPTDSFLSVVFTNPVCQAEPLHTPLYPTQLFEAIFIFTILTALLILKKRKQFDGQLFLIYLMVYAAGRAVLEIFRGDIERGFLIKNVLSNSQFISLIVISVALYFYIRLNRTKRITTR
ncbi:MAG: prolipoprotein diacylglyceryl transferase [Cyclobacteriaceae bacterium]|nr:prolipoprotein diacylglyceryl transferase [Cyclobacteriaceae bacterium]